MKGDRIAIAKQKVKSAVRKAIHIGNNDMDSGEEKQKRSISKETRLRNGKKSYGGRRRPPNAPRRRGTDTRGTKRTDQRIAKGRKSGM